jgi:hypothetical protein
LLQYEIWSVFKQTITINEKNAMQYDVPVIKLTELSVDEIVDKVLTFLLPLYMVKHRHKVANCMKSLTDPYIEVKAGTKEKLQKLVYVDIEGIEKGYSLGQYNDAGQIYIFSMMDDMLKYLYPGFERTVKMMAIEKSVVEGLKKFQDAALIAEKKAEVAEKKAEVAEKIIVDFKKEASTAIADANERAANAEKEAADAKKAAEENGNKIVLISKFLAAHGFDINDIAPLNP